MTTTEYKVNSKAEWLRADFFADPSYVSSAIDGMNALRSGGERILLEDLKREREAKLAIEGKVA